MQDRRIRLIYEYMTIEKKKIALKFVQEKREILKTEVDNTIDKYPEIVKEVLLDTLDRWQFEIEELTYDINNNIGPIRQIPKKN
ncbi:hypothetical protein [Bacillus salipaludis]|uniref:hypothetical protein n=1 Tax=Bacillus salipaludis TaxID=2547811 RepID=UPI002E1E3D81|nr:hypothetical protein [Bacillus salipaludis]